MKKLLLLLCCLSAFRATQAQTFTGTGGAIPDNSTVTSFPLAINNLSPSTLNSLFGLQSVCLTLAHTNVSDLTLHLQAPDGTLVELAAHNGGTGDNFTNTCFTNTSTTYVATGSAPFNGNYRPTGVLGTVNNGQNPNGTWRLLALDNQPGTSGTLTSWRLNFNSTPAQPLVFTSSNLPIVKINTYGRAILDDPKIDAYMGIINHAPGQRNGVNDAYTDFHNKIGIELRGSSSQEFPQKSYSVETRDVSNAEHDTTVLGMPADNAWVLYAPYDDKTCLRNVLTYGLANQTGRYAARTRYCELFINGQYKGIYVLMEKIKRGSNRVNIKKLQVADTLGDKLTGGYIFKVDKPTGTGGNEGWNSTQPSSGGKTIRFLYEYPKATDIAPAQGRYLRAYVDSTERALASATFASPTTGYAKYIDVNSFVDYFIMNELSRNVDGYRLSTYLHKKRRSDGGKIVAGPVWDYNIAWWNANYCAGNQSTGWAYNFNAVCPTDGNHVPFWWQRLLQDPAFANALKCRWTNLRQHRLHLDSLNTAIDGYAARVDEAKDRHFVAWPILGVYTWPNPSPIPATYPAEIAALKSWLSRRVAWLDANMPGTCSVVAGTLAARPATSLQVFPNPFSHELRLQATLISSAAVQVEMTDITGRQVAQMDYGQLAAGPHELPLDAAQALAPGLYLVKVTVGGQTYNLKVVKQ